MGLLRAVVALVALALLVVPASAQEAVHIGTGFGLAFLPAYICEDLKLVEKYAKRDHLELKASYTHFVSASATREAIANGSIDIAPFGTAPLLTAWEKTRDTPKQIVAVSGLTTLSPVLLATRPELRTIADFRAGDRIAIPSATAPQLYFLEMQSEKVLGRYDKLRSQTTVLPHPQALTDLLAGTNAIAGYFSSAPFTEIALGDSRVHKVLNAADVVDGKASFLIFGATKAYLAEHPKAAEAIAKAIDEAARIIRTDPHHAAEIYLVHEPSKTMSAAALAAMMADIKDEFGSPVHGIAAFADFMGRHGELKAPPLSWKEIVAPALLSSPST